MIREYLRQDGTIAQYDTATGWVQYLDAGSRSIVTVPHQASEDELTEYRAAYPESTVEERAAKEALISTLYSALLTLRNVTEDSTVTIEEVATAFPAVRGALEAYRDYSHSSQDPIVKLMLLILSQSVQSILLLVTDARSGYSAVANSQFFMIGEIESLQADLESFRSDFDAHQH